MVEGTTHTVRQKEKVAFTNWINRWVALPLHLLPAMIFSSTKIRDIYILYFFQILPPHSNFASDPDLGKYNISIEANDLYEKCKDGVVLW